MWFLRLGSLLNDDAVLAKEGVTNEELADTGASVAADLYVSVVFVWVSTSLFAYVSWRCSVLVNVV